MTVVLNSEDYSQKIRELLNSLTYTRIPRDPTTTVVRRTGELVKWSSLEPDVKKTLRCPEGQATRLYGLPKISKEDVPLRPVVSAVGLPTYTLAKYVTGLLQPFIGRTESYVRDSSDFVKKLRSITLGPGEILVSFDVVSLFTMVSMQEVFAYIGELFPADIVALFRHILTTSYFRWDGSYYEQFKGVAIRNPFSPVLANFCMERFEQAAIHWAPLKPKYWLRYVNDTFVVWSHGEDELSRFVDHLNGVYPRIQFTMEKEADDKFVKRMFWSWKGPMGELVIESTVSRRIETGTCTSKLTTAQDRNVQW